MKRRTTVKQNIYLGCGLSLLGLLSLILAACASEPPPPVPTGDSASVAPAAPPAAGSVTANGVLLAIRQVDLSFGTEGFVATVETEIGDRVEAGQTLVTLRTDVMERRVAQAELDLRQARLRLAQLEEPADEADVEAAEAAVSDARAAYQQAQMNLTVTEHSVSVGDEVRAARYARDEAYRTYQDLVNQLGAEDRRVTRAHDAYLDALGAYNRAVEGAELELTTARNEVGRAAHALQQAQNHLDRLLDGADERDVELAQIDVKRAELALAEARSALEQAVLTAPFDGTIAAVEVDAGEWATPGKPAAHLLDLSRWRVETKNVGELEIARITEGQTARVRVNAFGDQGLEGRVVAISPVAVVQQGDTTYTLLIELEPTDLNLRPGMTAQVEILAE